jgi:hypothetical protein
MSPNVSPRTTTPVTPAPRLMFLGTTDQLVLEGGNNNDDGWSYSKLAKTEHRPVAKPTILSTLLFWH